jgi:hypothetical protein
VSITRFPRSILRLQYQLVRRPLELIENRVVVRMPAEAPARLVYERSLGVLDAIVGRALDDPQLSKRGIALAERSDALGRAARLEATATQTKQQADAELRAKREEAVEDQGDARAAKEQAVEEARTAAEERKREAAQEAQQRTASAKQQADQVAAQRKQSTETAKRQEEERIRAAEKQAVDTAQSKLRDAQTKSDEAEGKRARADRVEGLADVEKQKRQSARASES